MKNYSCKAFGVLILFTFYGSLVCAKTVKCRAENANGSGAVEVPVTIRQGAVVVPIQEVDFSGKKLSVVWDQATPREGQAVLNMKYGTLSSSMYDFELEGHFGPINMIAQGTDRFLCWVAE